jgi:hypothetical protein
MRNLPGALFVALAVMLISSRAQAVQDGASRLVTADGPPGGKSVAPSPKPRPRLKLEERKAEERKPDEPKPAEEKDPEILVLPKVEVTAPKATDTPFEKRLEQLDQEQAWEEQNTKLSWLETFLNGAAFANARTAQARERVEIMNWERMLLVALLGAKTDEERAKIRAEIALCKAMRR